MDRVVVTAIGTILVGFIYWFFFGKKDEAVLAGERIDVLVEGGYKPSAIKVKRGRKTVISLLRKDKSDCLEEFILPDFKIKKYLPVDKKVDVEITPNKSGTFQFHCGMNMFHGKIIVE